MERAAIKASKNMPVSSSRYVDSPSKQPHESRLFAPTKASLAKSKVSHSASTTSTPPSRQSPKSTEVNLKLLSKLGDRVTSSSLKPRRLSHGTADSPYSSDEDVKLPGRKVLSDRGSSSSHSEVSNLTASRKYSDSVRAANSRSRSTFDSTEEKMSNAEAERLSVPEKKINCLSPVRLSSTLVKETKETGSALIQPPSETERPRESSSYCSKDSRSYDTKAHSDELTVRTDSDVTRKTVVSRFVEESSNEGYSSPVSTLELRLSEDSVSPTSASSTRPSGLEAVADCDSDAESEKRSESKSSSKDGFAEQLELSSIEFISDSEEIENDVEYILHILVASGAAGMKMPTWHSSQLPIDPLMFHQLEKSIADRKLLVSWPIDHLQRSEVKRQRKLVFDAVNESLARSMAPFVFQPVWIKPHKSILKPRLTGKALLREVWAEINSWPVPTAADVYEILDDAARREMVSGIEKWDNLSLEEAEVVFELEAIITCKLIEEAITCFSAIEYKRMKRDSGLEMDLKGELHQPWQ